MAEFSTNVYFFGELALLSSNLPIALRLNSKRADRQRYGVDMKRLLKWLGILVLGFVGIIAIASLVVMAYKKEILASINEKLQETVNGAVKLGDYHVTMLHSFPAITISLDDIYLYGPRYETFKRPFLYADRVDVNLEIFKLFRKEIGIKSVDIEHGEIFVFRTAEGYSNTEVLKTRKTSPESQEKLVVVDLKKINLEDVKVSFQDSLKKKAFGIHFIRTENVFSESDSTTNLHVAGNMTFVGLMLNASKGSFLKNKNVLADLNLELNVSKNNLVIQQSKLIFDKSSIGLTGNFTFRDPENFELNIESDEINYEEGLSILSDTLAKKLSHYHVDKPIKLLVKVNGILQQGSKPAVDVTFSFSDAKISADKVVLENTSINGTFMNHLDPVMVNGDHNAQLRFSSLTGRFNNIPVKAVVTLTDMKDPLLDLKATFDADLKDLNQSLDSTKLKLTGGHFTSNFTYKGKLREYLDDSRTNYQGHLKGEAKVTNGSIHYFARKITINKIEAVFGFTEKKFEIRDLDLVLNKSDIQVRGSMTDFIPFFVSPETSGKVKLNISSPKLDISGLLQPRRQKKSVRAKAASNKKLSEMVDRLGDELDFDLDFHIKEFVNKRFKASELKGNLILKNNQFTIRNLAMDFAKGKVNLNLKVSNLERLVNPLKLQAKLEDVDLKRFFYAFNNFNQTTFRHEHVDGRLSLDIDLTAEINDKLEFLVPNLKGTAKFKIQDGRLKDFEPMQRLSNFLLKGRDFSDVQFNEIATRIALQGTKMEVDRMEIESTVLTMFIEGRYDLKDSSDLSIQVPLSNLKKRDQDIAPENIGVDAKAGASVYLRVRPDKNGKTAITYDPFKKLRKKKRNGKGA